jgi:protease-4
LQSFYDHFLELVADNREMDIDSVDALAQGRVWTGREALANGLVDEMGGLKQALDYTASQARISDYRIALFPEVRRWFVLPGRSLFGMVAGLFSGNVEVVDKALDNLPQFTEEGIYARMPYDLRIE